MSPYRSATPLVAEEDAVAVAYLKRRRTLGAFMGVEAGLLLTFMFCAGIIAPNVWYPCMIVAGVVMKVVYWRLDTRTQQTFEDALARERESADAAQMSASDGAQRYLGQ